MKIAYLVNQYPKPSHTFIRREIQALERLGVHVLRISIRGWNDALADQQDERERQNTRYVLKAGAAPLLVALLKVLVTRPVRLAKACALAIRLAFDHAERPLPVHLIYVAEACQIVLWLESEGIQHLHAHFGTNSAEVAMLTHVLGGPSWSMTIHGPAEFDRKSLLNLPEKIQRARFVVAISSFGRSQLYRLIGHESWSKVHVVHCGVDPSFHQSATDIEPADRRVVCVGRLAEPKGQLLLIEAARILRDCGEGFDLVLAGDGEMRGQIETLVARYDLGGRVRLTGWLDGEQIRKEILGSCALVLPSFAEGLPVVIMEAMALQRPVISTYVAGIPELVLPGKHGWLIPAGDIDALVSALRRLFQTPKQEWIGMGQAARSRVKCRHDIDQEAEKLRGLFVNAINSDR